MRRGRRLWRRSEDAVLSYRVFRNGTLLHTVSGTSWFWERTQMTFLDTGLAPGSPADPRE